MNLALFATTVLIWGSTWIAIAAELGPVPVLTSVFYRFALAAALLWPVLVLSGRLSRTRPRDHLFMGLQGLCLFSLNFLCFYNATAFIPSGLVSVIFSLATVLNALNARLFFAERITARALMATTVGVAGLVRLLARRQQAAPPAPRLVDRLDALSGQEAAVRRVALLHLARAHLPDLYTDVQPTLYRRDSEPDLDALEAALRRHV